MRDCSIARINGLFYYTDFETNTAVPICNKPDCRHLSIREDKNTTCNAANDDSTTIFPYQGKLYGIETREDGIGFLVSELMAVIEKVKKILLMLAVSLMKESLFGINYFIFMMRRLILLRAMGYRR